MTTMIEFLKPDFVFTDDRGTLKQLVHNGYKQINVITAKANCIRGCHYHKINKEAFYVISGKFILTTKFNNEEQEFTFKKDDMFVILPKVYHSFNFVEDTVLVSMYDKGVEISATEKDIYNK